MPGSYSMIDTLREFVEKAGELSVEYMVAGSFAMSDYGEIRSTRDIDIVIQLPEKQASSFVASFGGTYYISEDSVRRAIASRSSPNTSLARRPLGPSERWPPMFRSLGQRSRTTSPPDPAR